MGIEVPENVIRSVVKKRTGTLTTLDTLKYGCVNSGAEFDVAALAAVLFHPACCDDLECVVACIGLSRSRGYLNPLGFIHLVAEVHQLDFTTIVVDGPVVECSGEIPLDESILLTAHNDGDLIRCVGHVEDDFGILKTGKPDAVSFIKNEVSGPTAYLTIIRFAERKELATGTDVEPVVVPSAVVDLESGAEILAVPFEDAAALVLELAIGLTERPRLVVDVRAYHIVFLIQILIIGNGNRFVIVADDGDYNLFRGVSNVEDNLGVPDFFHIIC